MKIVDKKGRRITCLDTFQNQIYSIYNKHGMQIRIRKWISHLVKQI